MMGGGGPEVAWRGTARAPEGPPFTPRSGVEKRIGRITILNTFNDLRKVSLLLHLEHVHMGAFVSAFKLFTLELMSVCGVR